MIRRRLRYTLASMLAAALAVSGCGALLDVKDIYLDPNATSPGSEGGVAEGSVTSEGGSIDGGGDGSTTCTADTTKDPNHCGRCGHSCLGGACTAGVCEAVELGSVVSAPMTYVVASDQYVFASTIIGFTTEAGGIWRVAKSGGPTELYANIRYAEQMAVVGDKLYFVSDDDPADGTKTGGLYSCPVTGAAPCTPTLIAAGTNCRALTVDQNKIYYGDDTAGKGLMLYAPPAAPTVFRGGFGFSSNAAVVGSSSYYTAVIFASPRRAKVFESFADGGANEIYAYENPNSDDGRLIADKDALLYTAYDFETTTGGVVRRIPRTTGSPCDLGGTGNKRPYGVYADTNNVYWANQGEGADAPYTNGTIVSCEQAGCCATPKVMWTGDGEPRGVTGDANALYFVTHAKGSIWKIAKP